ncbi:ATP-grasp domain-containing protein [Pedobacter sp.]|uniref:ATP-grasp domain-containing protein n=1 Tax=Pedobacter sp. TaxID=1411316 RepID=UPI003BA9BB9A
MKNNNINILFLGGAKRVSLAEKFIEEGKLRKLNVSIFSYELNDEVPISFVGTIILGLKWGDEKLYDHLEEVIQSRSIDIVIPFLDFATLVSARLAKLLKNKSVFIPVSDEDTCKVFFNKSLSNTWCLKNNINVPSNLNEFPLIAKPITGSSSKGIFTIEGQVELDQIKNKHDYLIQKFISGKEYSVDAYVSPKSKKIISIVPRQRLETQGGESIKSVTVKNCRFIEFAKDVILKSNLIGPVTLQFIHDDSTDELFFIEVNPRFGGAVVNSIFAGANSPAYLLNDFLDIDNAYTDDWIDSFLMVRRFSEYYKICN